jgi:hypothetical protein
MSPVEMKLTGLMAWQRAREETAFTPAPPSFRVVVGRKVSISVGWIERQLRRRLARRSVPPS